MDWSSDVEVVPTVRRRAAGPPGWLSRAPQPLSAHGSHLQGGLHSRNSSGAELLSCGPKLNGFSYLVPVPLIIMFSSGNQVL